MLRDYLPFRPSLDLYVDIYQSVKDRQSDDYDLCCDFHVLRCYFPRQSDIGSISLWRRKAVSVIRGKIKARY